MSTNFLTIDLNEIHELLSNCEFKHDKVMQFTRELREACSTKGFFYIKNHGFKQTEIDEMFLLAKTFFSGSIEDKMKFYDEEMKGTVGYGKLGNENLSGSIPDYKEGYLFKIKNLRTVKHPVVYEENLDSFEAFLKKDWLITKTILTGIALSLELEPDFFCKAHNDTTQSESLYRIIHYPPIKNDMNSENTIRAGSHSDYGSMTLLFHETTSLEKLQSATGLQVLKLEKDSDGLDIWENVTAKENCIVVNLGDMLAFWTEGRYRSAIHRVIVPEHEASKKSRYSLVHFIHPDAKFPIYPIKSSTPAPFPAKEVSPGIYKSPLDQDDFTYGDTIETYLKNKFSKTFS